MVAWTGRDRRIFARREQADFTCPKDGAERENIVKDQRYHSLSANTYPMPAWLV